MAEPSDILWNFYQEHCVWERHHEAQRTSMTTLFVAIAAGVLGVITFDSKLNFTDLPLTAFLAMLGLFGAIFAAKHYERFCQHQERANQYRRALDAQFPSAGILSLRFAADEKVHAKFPRLRKLRLHSFWIGLHILIALFGTVLTAGIVLGWFI